jgi:hypothetical protein
VRKLMPSYYRKLDNIFSPVARYRELAQWRKAFKKEWKRCEGSNISNPDDPTYAPNAHSLTCTCRAFIKSRFLLCKHVVQLLRPVPPSFFAEVRRYCTLPIWRHKAIVALHPPTAHNSDLTINTLVSNQLDYSPSDGSPAGGGDEELDPFVDVEDEGRIGCEPEGDGVDIDDSAGIIYELGKTPAEEILDIATLCERFTRALRYQAEFNDSRFLSQLYRSGRSFFQLAENCLEHERRAISTRTQNPRTWGHDFTLAMFYRSRPRAMLSCAPSSDVGKFNY